MTRIYNFEARKARSKILKITISSGSIPINISGVDITMEVKEFYDDETPLITKSSDVAGQIDKQTPYESGVCYVYITSGDMAPLNRDTEYPWDMMMLQSGNFPIQEAIQVAEGIIT